MAVHVRYIVNDVDKAVEFYRDHLGFEVKMHPDTGFAALARDDSHLYLNVAGAGGGGKAGGEPKPGGWNRFQIEVDDLDAVEERLRSGNVNFRGERVSAPAGDQVLVEDPSGNPIELFQPSAS